VAKTIWETSPDGRRWDFRFEVLPANAMGFRGSVMAGAGTGMLWITKYFNEYPSSQVNHLVVSDGMSRSEGGKLDGLSCLLFRTSGSNSTSL